MPAEKVAKPLGVKKGEGMAGKAALRKRAHELQPALMAEFDAIKVRLQKLSGQIEDHSDYHKDTEKWLRAADIISKMSSKLGMLSEMLDGRVKFQ